jgi:hypothetical protein
VSAEARELASRFVNSAWGTAETRAEQAERLASLLDGLLRDRKRLLWIMNNLETREAIDARETASNLHYERDEVPKVGAKGDGQQPALRT